MYKLLALDIDGTLINQNLEITGPVRRAIKAARCRGVEVTLATGRSFHSAKNYADQLELDRPLICANGAIIRHRDGRVYQEHTLPATIAPLIAKMAAAGLFVQAYHREGISTLGSRMGLWKWVEMICDLSRFRPGHVVYSFREYRRSRLYRCPNLPALVEQGSLGIHKLFATGGQERLARFHQLCSDQGFTVEYYPGYNGRMYLEIMPAGITKGTALRKLAADLGVAMEQVIAVGDNLNDITMVDAAGLGVAMGNGHGKLKERAAHVTLSNEEDGVAAVIRDFILAPDKARPAI